MPQLVKKRRSGWAVLAAGALVASLLAVGATPAGADPENADHKAATSACVGDALGDQMFTDVSDGHVFRDAINCIAYYGITNGTGDGSTYSPNDDVTRAEMAVFIARAAGVAGVDLGDAMDEGYDDIGDVWAEAQDAINRLTAKGVFPGGDSFRPGDAMTRAEMAGALVGLLDAAGAIDILDNGGIDLDGDGDADEDDADDYFADARALSPVAVDRAAAALFELGVTNGTGRAASVDPKKTPLDTKFDPGGTVDRGQMAAFITRTLAHTSARPEGLSAQAVGSTVRVSVRDENFAPVANAWVEVFFVSASDEGDALNADGSCGSLIGDANDTEGTRACEIDGGDRLTNGDGDATTQAIPSDVIGDDGAVAWAWTGDVGDEVDADTALFRVEVNKAPAPAETSTTAAISNDLAGAVGKFGSSVTVTLQLQDADGNVTGGAVSADEPAKWLVEIQTYVYNRQLATPARVGTSPILVSTVPVTSDADGKGTFVLAPPPDPDPNNRTNAFEVAYIIRSRCELDFASTAFVNCAAPATGTGTFPAVMPNATVTDGDDTTSDDHTGGVVFSDEAAVPHSISIETSSYVQTASRAGRVALNRAKATLMDQFGDPVRSAKLTLTSDLGRTDDTTDTDGASSLAATTGGTAKEFTTGSDGSYTFGYTYSSTTGDVETIQARYFNDPTPDQASSGDEVTITKDATVRWAQEAPGSGSSAVVDGDIDANQIVVVNGAGAALILTYDDDDRLDTSDTDVASSTPASMAQFEEKLAGFLGTEATAGELVTWSNYMNRPRHTSVFTLHAS